MTARDEEPESIQTSSVSLDLVAASAPFQSAGLTSAQSSVGGFFEPDIRAVFLDQVGGVANDLRVQDGFALRIVKRGDRHTPGALARDAPVRTRFHRAFDAVLAPVRNPFDVVDRLSSRAGLAELRRDRSG